MTPPLEQLREIEERRPEDHEEHRGEDERDRREEHLDRRLHRTLLGRGLTAQTRVSRLYAKDPAQRDAELIGLDDRPGEVADLRRGRPLRELLQRVVPAL